jgi:hypothetical protein
MPSAAVLAYRGHLLTENRNGLGISVHMLPKGVAELAHRPWGSTVDLRPYLKPESQATGAAIRTGVVGVCAQAGQGCPG